MAGAWVKNLKYKRTQKKRTATFNYRFFLAKPYPIPRKIEIWDGKK